jgi:hypothetical protein
MASCYQKIFVLWGLSQRKLQTLSDAKAVPSFGLGTIIYKYPFIPISPACNKLAGVGNSQKAEEIRCRIGLSANQKLGKLLSRKDGGEI